MKNISVIQTCNEERNLTHNDSGDEGTCSNAEEFVLVLSMNELLSEKNIATIFFSLFTL